MTREDSGGGQIGLSSYGYDGHGRVRTVTDARNGTSINLDNAADQITTVSTPAPGGSYLSQTTTTSYDNMGRAWKVTLGGDEPRSTGACCLFAGCDFLLRMKRP